LIADRPELRLIHLSERPATSAVTSANTGVGSLAGYAMMGFGISLSD
jgi:hypothetical protein